ncbi:helix-turn-helix domain-containing protein [Raineya orbicola]|jgi:transcriptional regulator with XRE-family HTH domain|uniref:Helix-turn-helix protein n=1 Tax=Raineya orbicola TaxID=2016530 RepID=A0A2N3I958_9BACT|nr:helix-turn-helix transcriptional regulator [Raineya orbicola]PKQ66884.1 Helix-turn-helix protein [Raineya orbicola]
MELESKNFKEETSLENKQNDESLNKDFAERLKILIDMKGIQPSRFADEIGVQRSGLSHIIAGRNKPSVDFLQKLVQRYPDTNVNWLLTGIGEPIIEQTSNSEILEKNSEISTEIEQKKEIPIPNKEKEIERILVFYADKTFETFNLFNPYKVKNSENK